MRDESLISHDISRLKHSIAMVSERNVAERYVVKGFRYEIDFLIHLLG